MLFSAKKLLAAEISGIVDDDLKIVTLFVKKKMQVDVTVMIR